MRIKVTVLTIMFLLVVSSFFFLKKQSSEGLTVGCGGALPSVAAGP